MPSPERRDRAPDPLARFHPTIDAWFRERLGEPTPPQVEGWPAIARGDHTLIAAPTGSGKTLAAFLFAIDTLLAEGAAAGGTLPDETHVLYISPLKALGNDVQKNLQRPLEELRERDPSLPEVRVTVRSGDTPQSERTKMTRRPPHILVTTPESLYILLTSEGGRRLLSTVRSVIVDEIHAMLGDKRGAHLALSLERLEELCRQSGGSGVQRIGLSATQKPVEDVARFLVGTGRECTPIDIGHRREMDLALEVPSSPLETVCSHEVWDEIYHRIVEHIEAHRTTLIFTGTRKLAEQVSRCLQELLGSEEVTCHHSSLSKERRLDAEQRLKDGELRALVATASLELGIDIGDVDLVIQLGTPRSIATFLQRVGRAGHTLAEIPKGRLLPLTIDELVDAAAILRAVRRGTLDRTPQPTAPLDILAQQIVAECAAGSWSEDELYARARRAWPYRNLERSRFDAILALHSGGRLALLHRDGVGGIVRGTRRARLTAITSGGAIPDRADYRVLLEPEGTFVGTVDEDFAIESSGGDIFQLGSTSWQIIRVEPGVMHVADARGAPPTLPFWFGEAPSRTAELTEEVGMVRLHGEEAGWLERECGIPPEAAQQIVEYLKEGRERLGAVPTHRRVIAERFFDESGGQQLVIHNVAGGRINRAWGLALRKKFCRNFGFELQAAANEDAIVLSLGLQHSFEIAEVFRYVRPEQIEKALTQAILPLPMFSTRWRWNTQRSLQVPRMQGGKKVPPPIQRMRADDLLAQSFPEVLACGENLPPGDFPIPDADAQPMVAQTIEDCLTEAMDVEGASERLEELFEGSIETIAVDVPAPSAFARRILNAAPYAFLDDAPLEERRTQAVMSRRGLRPEDADEIGALSPEAVARVRVEAWPDPQDGEEMHEVLLWIGFVTEEEADRGGARRGSADGDADSDTIPWRPWLEALVSVGRAEHDADRRRYFATESTRDPKQMLRGRLEAIGPFVPTAEEESLLRQLEGEGAAMRARLEGREQWCDRRLLARIQRYTLEDLRQRVAPVSAADFLRFLADWQHLTPEHSLEGPGGVAEAVRQLAGVEIAAPLWEREILPVRVKDFLPKWLDDLCLTGEITWGRLWGSSAAALRVTPISLIPRSDLPDWLGLASPPEEEPLRWSARLILEHLRTRGATFGDELQRSCDLLPSHLDEGLVGLISHGWITNDAFGAMRRLLVPTAKRSRRGYRRAPAGRWSLFRTVADPVEVESTELTPPRDGASAEFVAYQLLLRYGVVFRRVIERERIPVPWRDLLRVYRRMELRGEIRGGRFVGGRFTGEQFALPRAVSLLRAAARRDDPLPQVARRDPFARLCDDMMNPAARGRGVPEPRASSTD